MKKNLLFLVLALAVVGGVFIYGSDGGFLSTSLLGGVPKIATLHTNMGDIEIELRGDKAPRTVDNFVKLARDGKYDGVVFHRVIDDFMIQTGDFTKGDGTGGHAFGGGYFDDEFSADLTHVPGAVSMANRGPNTNGSQFFIVQNPQGTHFLNNRHNVFGLVTNGMNVVNEIAKVETDASDRPLSPVVIESIDLR